MHWGKRLDDEYPTRPGFIGTTLFAAIPATMATIDRIAHKKLWAAHTSLQNLPWRDMLGIAMFSVVVLAVWALIFWKGGLEIN